MDSRQAGNKFKPASWIKKHPTISIVAILVSAFILLYMWGSIQPIVESADGDYEATTPFTIVLELHSDYWDEWYLGFGFDDFNQDNNTLDWSIVDMTSGAQLTNATDCTPNERYRCDIELEVNHDYEIRVVSLEDSEIDFRYGFGETKKFHGGFWFI